MNSAYLQTIGVLLLLSLSACKNQPEATAPPPTAPPNILLIVADDHGTADMSALGILDDVQTPHLDALADSGVRFAQAYASSPICSPSRMSIITGAHNQRFGTYWYGGEGIHRTDLKTIPELLKQKNYATGYIGKVHYGKADSNPENRNFPMNHGFDYFFGHTSARKHYLNHDDTIEQAFMESKNTLKKKGQSLRQGHLWRNYEPVDTVAFTTELFGKEARQFIQKHQSEPFFLQLSFNAVHNFTHQLPEEYLKEHQLKGYRDWDPAIEEYYDWYEEGRLPNNPEGRAHYLGQLHYLDQEIGRVLSYLEELELSDNTLVIYIGDNGGSTPIYAMNDPLRGSKYLLYQGGVRVPLLMSFPGEFEGKRTFDNQVSGMDILPTICQLAGIDIPSNIDGIDLTPLLRGTDSTIGHDTLFWDTGHERAVLVDNWKWHEATNDQSARYEMVELELGQFLRNLNEDIGETQDFTAEHQEKAAQLQQSLSAWQEEIKREAGAVKIPD